MRPEIKKWFDQADYDFESAKDNFKIERYNLVVYLCQQAVEKALKALVVKKEKEPDFFLKSHSLIFLGKKVKIPENFHSFLRDLTPHYSILLLVTLERQKKLLMSNMTRT